MVKSGNLCEYQIIGFREIMPKHPFTSGSSTPIPFRYPLIWPRKFHGTQIDSKFFVQNSVMCWSSHKRTLVLEMRGQDWRSFGSGKTWDRYVISAIVQIDSDLFSSSSFHCLSQYCLGTPKSRCQDTWPGEKCRRSGIQYSHFNYP